MGVHFTKRRTVGGLDDEVTPLPLGSKNEPFAKGLDLKLKANLKTDNQNRA